jgi:hypothetical protein
MYNRFKWALATAISATSIPAIALLFLAACTVDTRPYGMRIAGFLLVLLLMIIADNFEQQWRMYRQVKIECPQRNITVEIGHRDTFQKRYRIFERGSLMFIGHTHEEEFGCNYIHAVLFSNGLLAVVQEAQHVEAIKAILNEKWEHHSMISHMSPRRLTMFWSNRSFGFIAEVV